MSSSAAAAEQPLPGNQPGPKVYPVVLWTILVGAFGAIPAALRYQRANALGLPGGRYWSAFAATLLAWCAAWVLLAVLVSASSATAQVMNPTELNNELVNSGPWHDTSGAPATATDAHCVGDNVRANGSGTYTCLVTFLDGSTQSTNVTVGSDGTWVTGP